MPAEFQKVLDQWHAMVMGKEDGMESGKPEEGKNNLLLAKICYYIRPDHKAHT